MLSIRKLTILTSSIFIISCIDATGSLLNFWSITGSNRTNVLLVEGLILFMLFINSVLILRWVYTHTDNVYFKTSAWISVCSLLLCTAGDIINFNLPLTFYRHEGIIKHDYLADSVLFFGPGYLLLLFNGALLIKYNQLSKRWVCLPILLAAITGSASVAHMHLTGTGTYVTSMTLIHAVIITAIGFYGAIIILSCGGLRAPPSAWLVGSGFIFACIADALIGNFWIYGNNGQGYFPNIRYINWIFYIGSQCLVIYLPYLLLSHKECIQ